LLIRFAIGDLQLQGVGRLPAHPKDLAGEEEIRLVKDEYNRFVSSYDHDSFVLNCKIPCRLVIEDHRDVARFIAGRGDTRARMLKTSVNGANRRRRSQSSSICPSPQ
jgi:hypothetical protein